MPTPGPLELVIILVIVLVIFGPKRLPSLGRQLGSGMREFKDSVTGSGKGDAADRELEDGSRDEDEVPAAKTKVPADAAAADAEPPPRSP